MGLTTRFLFVNGYFPPDEAATAQILGDLVETACREGYECRVVTSDRGYADSKVRYPRREAWRGALVERVRATGFGRGSTAGRALDYVTFVANAFVRLLSGPRPDVVIGLSTPPILGALAVIVARLRGARSVYWAMDVHPDVAFALGMLRPGSVAGRSLSAVSRWTVRSADLVVALGETMAGFLERQGAHRITIVHNWADETAIYPLVVDESAYRAARGWGSRFVVLYSGNMGLAHDFDTVIAAAGRLQARADIVFAFMGGGPRRKEVEHAATMRGLKNVEFHSAVSRTALGDSLAAGDIHLVTLRPGVPGLLVPSKIYGVLAAGRPTLYVGPPIGEVHDIVVSARCGTVVSNGDVEGLASSIAAYVDDLARRAREGLAARSLFERRFTKAKQTRAFLLELEAIGKKIPAARGTS